MLGISLGALAVLALSALVGRLAVVCRNGTLRPNRIVGYRTSLTLRDPEAWRQVHRAIAPWLAVAAAGGAAGAVAAELTGLIGGVGAAAPLLGGGIVWVMASVVAAIVPAHASARRFARSGDAGR